NNGVFENISTTSTLLLVRSASKYKPITGSTKLMSNEVTLSLFGSVTCVLAEYFSSGGAAKALKLTSKQAATAASAYRKQPTLGICLDICSSPNLLFTLTHVLG